MTEISPKAQEARSGLLYRRVTGTPASLTLSFDDILGDGSNIKANVIRLIMVQGMPNAVPNGANEVRLTVTQTSGLVGAAQVRFQSLALYECVPKYPQKLPLFRENGSAVIALGAAAGASSLFVFAEYA